MQLPERHAEHSSGAGEPQSPRKAPADEIKQMFASPLTLDETVGSFSGDGGDSWPPHHAPASGAAQGSEMFRYSLKESATLSSLRGKVDTSTSTFYKKRHMALHVVISEAETEGI